MLAASLPASRTSRKRARKEVISSFCIFFREEGRIRGLTEYCIAQRQRHLQIVQTDNIRKLVAHLAGLLTREEQRTSFQRRVRSILADLGSDSSTERGESEQETVSVARKRPASEAR